MNLEGNTDIYDPFLRKEVFESKPWYDEFLIFHNIGVCKVSDRHVAQVREAISRFLLATRVKPDNSNPGMALIIGDGFVEAEDLGEYIQSIRSQKAG